MELPLLCLKGHTGRLLVVLSAYEGWDVSTEVGGSVVSSKHCSGWHRVERFCATAAAACGVGRPHRVLHQPEGPAFCPAERRASRR